MYRFDRQASAILLAAGFTPEFFPADWEDIGGPESGPKLSGHPDLVVYSLPVGVNSLQEVVVQEKHGVCEVIVSPNFADWQDDF